MTSVRKSYISNSFSNIKLLPVENFANILYFYKESERKLLSLIPSDNFIKTNLFMTLGVNFVICL